MNSTDIIHCDKISPCHDHTLLPLCHFHRFYECLERTLFCHVLAFDSIFFECVGSTNPSTLRESSAPSLSSYTETWQYRLDIPIAMTIERLVTANEIDVFFFQEVRRTKAGKVITDLLKSSENTDSLVNDISKPTRFGWARKEKHSTQQLVESETCRKLF